MTARTGSTGSRRVFAALALAVAAWSAAGAVAAIEKPETRAASPDPRIDLNSATAEQLMTVPGIGKVLAARIVEFRDKHGPFRRVEDVMKVRGVGEKSFQKLRPYLTVRGSR